jgi:hypothetical protein
MPFTQARVLWHRQGRQAAGVDHPRNTPVTFIEQMLIHTPPYVFGLLGFCIWQGLLSLRPRTQPLWRLFMVPLVFTTLGILLMVMRPARGVLPVTAWMSGAVVLAPLGFLTGPKLLAIDRARRVVTRGGSPLPLVCNLIVFALQYGLAVARARNPNARAEIALAVSAVSGAMAGYCVGWTLNLLRTYARASEAHATPSIGQDSQAVAPWRR